MTIDLNAKHKRTAFDRAAVRASERWHKLHRRILAYNRKGELLFGELFDNAQRNGNLRELDQAYSMLVTFYRGIGYEGSADRLLREWIEKFPRSNRARLSAAEYLWYTRWQSGKALAQLKKIKLPKMPDDDEAETCYIAFELKGQLLLSDNKLKSAEKQMKLLADFTERHFEQLRFFFELRFVSEMVRRKLALRDCRRYLKTLSRRKQVEHDQTATKKLLLEVSRASKRK